MRLRKLRCVAIALAILALFLLPWWMQNPYYVNIASQILFWAVAALALIVVILGGTGSLLGALVGSFVIGFLYNFGQALYPDLAYVILFLPMVLVLVLRPQGLFGRAVL